MQKIETDKEKSLSVKIEHFTRNTPSRSNAPSGPIICPVGGGSGSGITDICDCPPNTNFQASTINKVTTYWCINKD